MLLVGSPERRAGRAGALRQVRFLPRPLRPATQPGIHESPAGGKAHYHSLRNAGVLRCYMSSG